ncbi:MAG: SsrA-binding protein, partial [Planctomycetes bacterium]|nr:SsrA-binding protein [Planctomycetota bacterium]
MSKGGKAKKQADGEHLVASNRRAFHDYHVIEQYEAGIQLVGTEVKSLRDGQCQLLASYARVDEHSPVVWLHSVLIPEYRNAGPAFQHEPQRKRKLLLHKREIESIRKALNEKGTTLVPL